VKTYQILENNNELCTGAAEQLSHDESSVRAMLENTTPLHLCTCYEDELADD